MSFTDLFIKRPVFATVLSLVIVLFGAMSYFKLPLRQFPKIDATTVNISTSFAGASPELMESQVTTPIENAIASVDGLDYITSSSTEGSSSITANFKLGYNINAAVADVMTKVNSVRWQLPKDVNDPVISKVDPNSMPILFIAFSNPNMKPVQINDYLVRVIQPVLSTLPGVGEAKIFGKLNYAMRLWLNPYAMASKSITLSDVMNAMQNNNLQAATGKIKNATQEFNTTIKSDLVTAKEFNNLIVKEKDGALLRLSSIGHADLGTPERTAMGIVNGQQANVMGIIARTDANPLVVAKEVKKELQVIRTELPKGMTVEIVWDNANFIADSISEVQRTVIEAVVFVILVIFLFLGSLRTVTIPLVTIPLSLIGVCGIMFLMGYSLNTMTFLAFVLAIGMVVDDAIVVSENIHRHIEAGTNRFEAAITGAREIRFAVIAMTLTLAAVYMPIIFTEGLTGALFKEFAFTLAATVVISGFIALTLSPMMCSKVLPEQGKEAKLEHWINAVTAKLAQGYEKVLRLVLKVRPLVAILVVIILAGCYFLYTTTPEELAPKEDVGGLLTIMTAPASANLQYTEKYAMEVDKIYQTIPSGVFRLMIVGFPTGVNSALGFLTLKPWSKRDVSVDQVIASLFPKLAKVTGVMAFPINPFSLPGSSGFQAINFVIKSTGSYSELYKVAQKIKQAAEKNPALANVNIDLKIDKPQYNIHINRSLAGILGVNMRDISTTVNMALGQPEFNRFVMNGRSYYVIPQIEKQFREKPTSLYNLYVKTITGQLVPLSSFVKIKASVVPQSLNHFQQMRSASINANAAPGYTMGQALSALEKIADKAMKPNMQYDFGGQSRQFVEASGTMVATFGFAIIFIFLILSAQFESFRDPLIVMFTVPLSTAGALIFLKLSGGTINIYTQIGLVTLVGLISKHGILMVEFANQLREQQYELKEAIIQAAKIRLRPILMTTAAMILGALPLAIASGAGANSRHQIGMVIIGGMLFGTLFTLFVVPTAYTYLTRKELH